MSWGTFNYKVPARKPDKSATSDRVETDIESPSSDVPEGARVAVVAVDGKSLTGDAPRRVYELDEKQARVSGNGKSRTLSVSLNALAFASGKVRSEKNAAGGERLELRLALRFPPDGSPAGSGLVATRALDIDELGDTAPAPVSGWRTGVLGGRPKSEQAPARRQLLLPGTRSHIIDLTPYLGLAARLKTVLVEGGRTFPPQEHRADSEGRLTIKSAAIRDPGNHTLTIREPGRDNQQPTLLAKVQVFRVSSVLPVVLALALLISAGVGIWAATAARLEVKPMAVAVTAGDLNPAVLCLDDKIARKPERARIEIASFQPPGAKGTIDVKGPTIAAGDCVRVGKIEVRASKEMPAGTYALPVRLATGIKILDGKGELSVSVAARGQQPVVAVPAGQPTGPDPSKKSGPGSGKGGDPRLATPAPSQPPPASKGAPTPPPTVAQAPAPQPLPPPPKAAPAPPPAVPVPAPPVGGASSQAGPPSPPAPQPPPAPTVTSTLVALPDEVQVPLAGGFALPLSNDEFSRNDYDLPQIEIVRRPERMAAHVAGQLIVLLPQAGAPQGAEAGASDTLRYRISLGGRSAEADVRISYETLCESQLGLIVERLAYLPSGRYFVPRQPPSASETLRRTMAGLRLVAENAGRGFTPELKALTLDRAICIQTAEMPSTGVDQLISREWAAHWNNAQKAVAGEAPSAARRGPQPLRYVNFKFLIHLASQMSIRGQGPRYDIPDMPTWLAGAIVAAEIEVARAGKAPWLDARPELLAMADTFPRGLREWTSTRPRSDDERRIVLGGFDDEPAARWLDDLSGLPTRYDDRRTGVRFVRDP